MSPKETLEELFELVHSRGWDVFEAKAHERIRDCMQSLLTCKDFNDMIRYQQKIAAAQELLQLPHQLMKEIKASES